MAIQRHLTNAPIVEAIIDFRVNLSSGFDVKTLLSLKDRLAQDYPICEEKWSYEGEFKFSKEQAEGRVKDTSLLGYVFRSADLKNVAQFRKDGFTFSRLNPYTNWDIVSTEAKRLWEIFLGSVPVQVIPRLATRYINRMEIPLPIQDFNEYLTAAPVVPEQLPQEITTFLSRITIADSSSDIMANFIQTMEKSAKPNQIALILDIDAYKIIKSGFTNIQIWPAFQQLREFKNRIFFSSVTEKTVRLFE